MLATLPLQANILIETEGLTHEEWLTYRRQGIGGSDLAAICGLSKWRTPFHVYLEKLGEAPEESLSEAAEWGTRLEPLIADKFASVHPEWAIVEKNVIYQHPKHSWALGNLDRMIICPLRGRGILEIKTASEYLRQEWDDGNIPSYYFVQLQWYLFVTGLDWGYFATLIGGNKYREYQVFRDDELIAELVRLASDFWHQYVLAGQAPPVDGSEASSILLSRMYPRANIKEAMELEGSELIPTYFNKRQQLNQLSEEIAEIENRFKCLLGSYQSGQAGDYLVHWANRTRNGVDSKKLKAEYPEVYEDCLKQTQYRQFSIKEQVKKDE